MDTCSFCGKATLGLIGQDEILDTCILQPGDAAIQANAYGDCHVRCLSKSEWGFHWHQCVRRWYQGHQSIRELDLANGLIAFVNSANGTTEILKVNGMHWTFRSAWVASLSRVDDQIYLLPRATDYTFSFGDRIELASAVQSELTLSTTYSLLSLASSLN